MMSVYDERFKSLILPSKLSLNATLEREREREREREGGEGEMN